jgi:hypothetical protein
MLDVILASEIYLLWFSGQWSYDVVDFFIILFLTRRWNYYAKFSKY